MPYKNNTIWKSDINLADWQEAIADEYGTTDIGEEEAYDFADELNIQCLEDERANLDITVPNTIIGIADMGLWDGRHHGYKLFGDNIKNILTSDAESVEWYADKYDIRCTARHHDGTNYILYRMFKPGVDPAPLLRKILSGDPVPQSYITHYTSSIRPFVANVYGWRTINNKTA